MADILDFGVERWGEDRAERYQWDLAGTFDTLAGNPRIARTRPDLPGNVRVHPSGSHVVAYTEDAGGILIVRVLHGRSDWRRLLA
ncbi:type II toxin-antitoxin system RelE/ParE family toxin [Jannaschia sp. Os4]|nr:type II toxin-antitoxin system RelE/ParE family toxin [Jannaschia sp. Os4]